MKTTTVVVQIGNSDDRLTQQRWAMFIVDIGSELLALSKIHFEGYSGGHSMWQNACFVAEMEMDRVQTLRRRLALVAAEYDQEAIALVVGSVEMIGPDQTDLHDRLAVGE